MRGEAQALQPETMAASGVPAAVPREAASLEGVTPISPAEDDGERLGLGDSATGDGRRDRSRFLDVSESALALEKPGGPDPVFEGQSFLELSDSPQVTGQPEAETEVIKHARGSGLTWFAVAALLVFVALGLLEWRSQVNHTNNGPVQVIKMRFQKLMNRYNPPPQTADVADANAAKPGMQAEPTQSVATDQNVPANANVPSATITNNAPISDARVENDAANRAPNAAQIAATPLPGGQPTAASRAVFRDQTGNRSEGRAAKASAAREDCESTRTCRRDSSCDGNTQTKASARA